MEAVPFDSGRWRFDAAEHEVEQHLGRESLRLRGGIATVVGPALRDGVLEFDVALSPERGFVGGIWRVRDAENYEWFFFRPHQSGNPDATQYTPVFNGASGWQLYHEEPYSVATAIPVDEWLSVRIRFRDRAATIEVAGEQLTSVPLKHDPAPGAIGLAVGTLASGHFSNVAFAAGGVEEIELPEPPPVPAGVIRSWSVSDAFAEHELDNGGAFDGRTWTRLESEPSGLTDLARLSKLGDAQNTVLARTTIVAEQERVARLDFGFSDRVRVYLNGRPLFAGRDAYRSRDYRFLGNIGWFDAVFLPLVRGRNELVLAVTEEVGFGWGLQAKLDDPWGPIVEPDGGPGVD